MTPPKILLAEDDDAVRELLQEALERDGFQVVTATSMNEALSCIVGQDFDVLLTDLHMPNAGDGFALVSAMRNAHPQALTLVLSGYPQVEAAMTAIVLQADEILTKPIELALLRETIRVGLANRSSRPHPATQSVASKLGNNVEITVRNWMSLVERDGELTCIRMSFQDLTGHLPLLLRDLITRLRLPAAAEAPFSMAARRHGEVRRRQGYTPAMIVEESRILQVSIFNTLQNNLPSVDFSKVLLDVITIADEVDSQLKQAMLTYGQFGPIQSAAIASV